MKANTRRIFWLLAGFVLLLAGGYILFRFDPLKHAFYPKCVFYMLTGLYCPGCGAARAFHALIHGDLSAALDYNPLLVISLPFIAVMVAMEVLGAFRNRRYGLLRTWQAVALAGLIVVYTVLRNLPSFSYLAP